VITLAFDTATDRCTVAATDGVRVAHRTVDGARQHASAILDLAGEVLHQVGGTAATLTTIVTADGPGSFTGLRVSGAVAKALTWRRPAVRWFTAPSLLVRAMPHVPAGGGVVLALSDALRGELYAAAWRIDSSAIVRIGAAPRAMLPEALEQFGEVDVVVGSIPIALVPNVLAVTGRAPITGLASLSDARALLSLLAHDTVITLVVDPASWEPDYGRPAEAQAVWERTHGTALPVTSGIAR
jgi:tRNA threonylcarbamoyladenosine biosynthesis protein TsaB